MAGERERPEDRLEELLSAGGAGEASEPRADETGELAALRNLGGEMRAMSASIPPSEGAAAFAAMTNQLEKARMSEQSGGLAEAVAAWWKRPMMRTGAAVTAAVLVLGGAGLGVAAATGNEPVRNFLGISSSSTIKVELTGTVVSVNGPVIEVNANGDVRSVVIDGNTDLKGDNDALLALDDIAPGQLVEVHGRLQPDNSILATRFHLQDGSGIGGSPTAAAPTAGVPTQGAPTAGATIAVPTAAGTPAAGPTADDHGDDRDDDQGEDDNLDDDNSGPGSGDDDRDDDSDDNSGSDSSGDHEDDDLDGHNSGSRSGNNDGGDDHDDDSSGSGGGDDHEDD